MIEHGRWGERTRTKESSTTIAPLLQSALQKTGRLGKTLEEHCVNLRLTAALPNRESAVVRIVLVVGIALVFRIAPVVAIAPLA